MHDQLLKELSSLDKKELDQPVLTPQSLVKIKRWALLWCAPYEAVHAGQVGLRRLRYSPLW